MMKSESTYQPILPSKETVKTPLIPFAVSNQPLNIRMDSPCCFCEHSDNCNKSLCFRRHHVENGIFVPYGQWFQDYVPERLEKPVEYLFCDRYEGNMEGYKTFFAYLCSTACLEYITHEQRKVLLELMCKKDYNISDDEFEYKFATWLYEPPIPEPIKITLKDRIRISLL